MKISSFDIIRDRAACEDKRRIAPMEMGEANGSAMMTCNPARGGRRTRARPGSRAHRSIRRRDPHVALALDHVDHDA
jgi:hypothetical protein